MILAAFEAPARTSGLPRLVPGSRTGLFDGGFRDWCGDTGKPREVAEAALAHMVRNKAEAAYARTDLLDRRRELMEAWCAYLRAGAGTGGN